MPSSLRGLCCAAYVRISTYLKNRSTVQTVSTRSWLILAAAKSLTTSSLQHSRLYGCGKPPQALGLPPAHCFNEPVHVPSSKAGHEGWLLAIVDSQTGPADFQHALWIIDAGNVGAGPIAKALIPHRLRPQVHGWWVAAAVIAAAA